MPGRNQKLRTYTQKELETKWAAPELLGAPTIRGECPVRGWWWRGSQKSNKHSKPPEIYKNSEKTCGFAHIFACKSPETPFFTQKYLTRYTHEMFFEVYINFKIVHYLSHCGVISVQSFGRHIRPQPHGLGLRISFMHMCGYPPPWGRGRGQVIVTQSRNMPRMAKICLWSCIKYMVNAYRKPSH